ncbi:MAG: hypothetical protein R2749_13935 [Acidimicrobiales bacterium]
MSSPYGPVRDWATDFDHVDPSYNERARRSGRSCAGAARCPH